MEDVGVTITVTTGRTELLSSGADADGVGENRQSKPT